MDKSVKCIRLKKNLCSLYSVVDKILARDFESLLVFILIKRPSISGI